MNMNYFSPCGYVAPQFYDKSDFGFLRSFTCGFLTTCGFQTIGTPTVYGGEPFLLHGTISHVPAEHVDCEQDDGRIVIRATVNDSAIFNRKFVLRREISCSLDNNELVISDRVRNEDAQRAPFQILYHMNIGYPLLDEDTEVVIPSDTVTARDARAQEGIGEWNVIFPPQAGFVEQCYYHTFCNGRGLAKVFNRNIGKGLAISFDAGRLDHFVQWKMMGERDYVLGLEPCNNSLDGFRALKENGTLKYLEPGEEQSFRIQVSFFDDHRAWMDKT